MILLAASLGLVLLIIILLIWMAREAIRGRSGDVSTSTMFQLGPVKFTHDTVIEQKKRDLRLDYFREYWKTQGMEAELGLPMGPVETNEEALEEDDDLT